MPWAPPWDEDDFSREFLRRPWWNAERMAFALTESGRHVVGTVTVAGFPGAELQVSWLAVDPHYRRRQFGQQLVSWAEHTCWNLGGRRLAAETLTAWQEAVAFYRAMGFR
jgi:GNAT superfamily N-acetyltransferase